MGRHTAHLLLKLHHRAMDRADARDRELARVGPGVRRVGVAVGVEARLHDHPVGRDVHFFGDDLRADRFMALALRHGTHCDHDPAVGADAGIGHFGITSQRRVRVDDARLPEVVGP